MKSLTQKIVAPFVCLLVLLFPMAVAAQEAQASAPEAAPAPAAAQAAGMLQIEISGLKDKQGTLYIAVFDSEDTWLGEETVLLQEVDIQSAMQGEMVEVDAQLDPGEYAFTVFYDENDNGDLDSNFIGIPKEPIALSNNAKARFGPPKYEDAKFDIGLEPVLQRISMVVAGK